MTLPETRNTHLFVFTSYHPANDVKNVQNIVNSFNLLLRWAVQADAEVTSRWSTVACHWWHVLGFSSDLACLVFRLSWIQIPKVCGFEDLMEWFGAIGLPRHKSLRCVIYLMLLYAFNLHLLSDPICQYRRYFGKCHPNALLRSCSRPSFRQHDDKHLNADKCISSLGLQYISILAGAGTCQYWNNQCAGCLLQISSQLKEACRFVVYCTSRMTRCLRCVPPVKVELVYCLRFRAPLCSPKCNADKDNLRHVYVLELGAFWIKEHSF